jgi:hypothetical protein
MADETIDPVRGPDETPADHEADHGASSAGDRDVKIGEDRPGRTDAANVSQDPAIPPENGHRASFDPATGAVHGSGSGAGGGQPGEDFDSDAAAGDGYPITGGEGRPTG